jgi:hypothetical protein
MSALPPHAEFQAPIRKGIVLFDATSRGPDAAIDRKEESTRAGPGARLRCRACGNPITDNGQRRSVDGSHSHTRTNPAGVQFTFGCFREAPGCRCLGAASTEHTWFTGCRWRIAACGGCGEHLGWSFDGAESFFGLILMRLVGEGGA